MATKRGKTSAAKEAREAEKKAQKKASAAEEEEATAPPPPVEPKPEEPLEKTELVAAVVEETTVEEAPPIEEPPTDQVYEEPVLTRVIVQRYEGEKVKGLYDGQGEALFYGGHHYKGQFSEGLMHGYGTYTWVDGVSYTGGFFRNQVTGRGIYTWKDGSSYEGEVLNGIRHGYGIMNYGNGMVYVGQWNDGKQSGKGRLEYDSTGKSYYDGDWCNNIRHGFGTRGYPSGNMYTGTWYKNMRQGEGTMIWYDQNQSYTGQWENGIQNGIGEWIWYQKRGIASQYSMNNTYRGQISQGLRHGYGIFSYANGARYEGNWRNNVKSGKGKFVFKNGRVYEGEFKDDHIVEYPQFEMDGRVTPDLSMIRTRTPLPSERASVLTNASVNTFSPSFQLDLDRLLMKFEEANREEESTQVMHVIVRHMTSLHRIYSFYSHLGSDANKESSFLMNQMQFWRFLKDCKFHHHNCGLADMDRWIAFDQTQFQEMHNPNHKVLFREFLNNLIVLAFHLYHSKESSSSGHVLATCLSQLITMNILKNACTVNGYIFGKLERANNVLAHQDEVYHAYKSLCTARKGLPPDVTMTMRQFLLQMKDMNLINKELTSKAIIDILAADDPKIRDYLGAVNLDFEMGFLDFLEALVGCAQIFVTEAILREPSVSNLSFAGQREDSVFTEDKEKKSPDFGKELVLPSSSSVEVLVSRVPVEAVSIPESPSKEHVEKVLTDAVAGVADGIEVPQKAEEMENLMANYSLIANQNPGDFDKDYGVTPATFMTEEMRQFNFWTHQIHIFFIRKFLPACRHLLIVKSSVRQALEKTKTSCNPDSNHSNTAGC